MKKLLKILGSFALVIIAALAVLMIKNAIDARRTWLGRDYYKDFQAGAPLEEKYAGMGGFSVSKLVLKHEDEAIQNIRIWYPSELEQGERVWPLVLVVNPSNTAALNYEPFFERLASWGFIVAGNDDRQTGTGLSASRTLDDVLALNGDPQSVLCQKVDMDNVGAVGYSQGGAGALRLVTEYDGEGRVRALFTGSAAYPHLALMWGGYDPSRVSIPWFMTAGTGSSDDAGAADTTAEFGGVAPLSSLVESYHSMTAEVFKVRARAVGAEHGDMQRRSDGYMTAWMLYHLRGDGEAGAVFLGPEAELPQNPNWQDVEKNQ